MLNQNETPNLKHSINLIKQSLSVTRNSLKK